MYRLKPCSGFTTLDTEAFRAVAAAFPRKLCEAVMSQNA